MNEAQRAAIRRHIGMDEVMELSAKVNALAEQMCGEDWEALEEAALDRRARDLAAAHGMSYDQALEHAADERPGILRGKHNGRDRGEEALNERATILMSREGIGYEEALMMAAEEKGGTLDAV
jgi:hypothetical protein